MSLEKKYFISFLILLGASLVQAQVKTDIKTDKNQLAISRYRLVEISEDILGFENVTKLYEQGIDLKAIPNVLGQLTPLDPGQIITIGRDLVALGEDVYKLVEKGRPTNTTSYSPISVIPKLNGQPVDLLETENWKTPKKRTFEIIYENFYSIEVVRFRYSIIYSYGGKYNNRGAYLTAVQIVPEHVRTIFGFDFTATMKLGGIQNQGTRDFPIAGATILMEYTVSSMFAKENMTDSFFISGLGEFKKL